MRPSPTAVPHPPSHGVTPKHRPRLLLAGRVLRLRRPDCCSRHTWATHRIRPDAAPEPVPVTPDQAAPGTGQQSAMPGQSAAMPYDWSGFYAGGTLGYAFGHSNWNAGQGNAGVLGFTQGPDSFNKSGSLLGGLQAGFNYLLPTVSSSAPRPMPRFQPIKRSPESPPAASPISPRRRSARKATAIPFFASGTARLRLGYAPGDWLFYVTGGFAWSQDQMSLTQLSTGASGSPTVWRLGWAAGAGVEVPIMPHWTARLEYLFTDYGHTTAHFGNGLQPIRSDLALSELRIGLNYQFGGNSSSAPGASRTRFAGVDELGRGECQPARSGDVCLAGLSGVPFALSRHQQSPRRWARARDR